MPQTWNNKIIYLNAEEFDDVIAAFNTPKICPMCRQPHRGDSDVCESCEDDLLPLPFTDKLEEDE